MTKEHISEPAAARWALLHGYVLYKRCASDGVVERACYALVDPRFEPEPHVSQPHVFMERCYFLTNGQSHIAFVSYITIETLEWAVKEMMIQPFNTAGFVEVSP